MIRANSPVIKCIRIFFVLLILGGFFQNSLAEEPADMEEATKYEFRGPFPVREQFPVDQLFLSLTPDDAKTLPKKDVRLRIYSTMVNTFEFTDLPEDKNDPAQYYQYYIAVPQNRYRLYVDTELIRTAIAVDYAVSDNLQVSIEIPFLYYSGGIMDSSIENFHKMFHLPKDGRDKAERDVSEIYLLRQTEFWIQEPDAMSCGLGDITLSAKYSFVDEDIYVPVVSLRFALKVPTGESEKLYGSGKYDYGVYLLVSKSIRKFRFHLNFGKSFLSNPDSKAPLDLNDKLSLFVGAEYALSRKWHLIAQSLIMNNLLATDDNFPYGDDIKYEGTFGVRYISSEHLFYDFGIVQNLNSGRNDMDLGFHFGLGYLF